MLFELLLTTILFCISAIIIGIPLWKLGKLLFPHHRDPVKEARIRVELAKAELEAQKLNAEAEEIYHHLYNEALQENNEKSNIERNR